MIFSAGHHANETTIGHLFGPKDLLVHDALAHDCIVQGAKLSGAKRLSFPHGDLAGLEAVLQRDRLKYEKCGILIEGVYSMDGDISDLPAFLALKRKWRCLLYVDESHSHGVIGPRGGGLRDHWGVAGGWRRRGGRCR